MTGARLAITSILPWVSLSLALLSPNTGRIVAADPDAAPAEAWPMARGSLAGTGRSASTLRLPLAEAWRRDFDNTAFAAGPVIAGGVVYIGDLDGGFHALDLATGEPRWTRRIDGAGFTSAAAVAADPALPLQSNTVPPKTPVMLTLALTKIVGSENVSLERSSAAACLAWTA